MSALYNSKEAWQKKFVVFEHIRDQITPEDEKGLDQAIDTAVQEARADTNNANRKPEMREVISRDSLITLTHTTPAYFRRLPLTAIMQVHGTNDNDLFDQGN